MPNEEILDQINCKLAALLSLAVARNDAEEKRDTRKPEEILGACGIKAEEIAKILGKNEAAVRKSLLRAGIRKRDN